MVRELTRTDVGRPKSVTEAYTRAYDALGARRTVQNEASKVYNRPRVQAAIADIEAKLEQDRRRAARGNAQAIQTALWGLYNDPEARVADKINSLKALASLLPKESKEDSVLKDSAVSKADLQARLEEILTSHTDKAIDISPDATTESDILSANKHDDIEAEVLSLEAEIISSKPDY